MCYNVVTEVIEMRAYTYDLGKSIKRLRTNKNLSQLDLSRLLNTTQANISSWETNRTEPSMDVMQKMCVIFDCNMSELTGSYSVRASEGLKNAIDQNNFNNIFSQIDQLSNNLNSEQLNKLIEYLKMKYTFKKDTEENEKQQQIRLIEYQKSLQDFFQ